MRVKAIQRYPLKAVFRKFKMSFIQTSRLLHARTSAREFNFINRFCQPINFAFHPHARGQRAAADDTPRHFQLQVRGHYIGYFDASSGTEKSFMRS